MEPRAARGRTCSGRCHAMSGADCPAATDALHGTRIGDLLGDAMVEAASEADPDDPEFVAEYTEECGRVASRIVRAVVTHLEAERRPSRHDP